MNKKKIMVLIAGLCCVILCVLINQLWAYIALVIALLLLLLNIYVFNKNRRWASNINNLDVIGRNYDTLIIGEPVRKETIQLNGNKHIAITCPGRSQGASIILAYRLFSLLRPGGTLIITYHYEGEKISSLDIPYIHEVTLLEMRINSKKKYLPLLFNPLQSIKVAIGTARSQATGTGSNRALEEFCNTRDITLLTYRV